MCGTRRAQLGRSPPRSTFARGTRPRKLTGLWPENGQTGEFRFVTTNTFSSFCDAHTTEYNEVSARVTVRAEPASKRTIAVHQSALRLIDYSANYNVFTNPTSTSISPQSRPSSWRSRRRRERGSGALLTGPAVIGGPQRGASRIPKSVSIAPRVVT